jgi:hypothetical protein
MVLLIMCTLYMYWYVSSEIVYITHINDLQVARQREFVNSMILVHKQKVLFQISSLSVTQHKKVVSDVG